MEGKIKFSEFPEAEEIYQDAIIPIVQKNANKKIYPSAILKMVNIHNGLYYGINPLNGGLQNSQNLQMLIDRLSIAGGGTIYLPSGQYRFSPNGDQAIGSHCIKMKSNVNIVGNGSSTVLMPEGTTQQGLDMFYFNDYGDTGSPAYLENCTFADFVIDASGTSTASYTSAGKGFMLNLIKNIHWENVTVKNTDATGFGVDCTINCSIMNCIAENCGKAAQTTDVGASGFGIGFGFSYDESILISGCMAKNCKKFGFFLEHQRRFSQDKYSATANKGFMVCNCFAVGNYYNFGGIQSINAMYRDCVGWNAIQHGYFFQNSENSNVMNSMSISDGNTSFVILGDYTDGGTQENKDIAFVGCISKLSDYGAKVVNSGSSASMTRNIIKDCFFNLSQTKSISTSGTMDSLVLQGNTANGADNSLGAAVSDLINKYNSWN